MKNAYLLFLVGFLLGPHGALGAVPAFPGAAGFGADTPHARGKPVFKVTRLDDLNMGQKLSYFQGKEQVGCLRWALTAAAEAGGGYIVFGVAGTVQLVRDAEVPSTSWASRPSSAPRPANSTIPPSVLRRSPPSPATRSLGA